MRIALLGGTSDIGAAIVEAWLARGRAEVVLAARAGSPRLSAVVERMKSAGASRVDTVDFDAADLVSHQRVIQDIFTEPVDVAIVAFGLLGDQELAWQDQERAVELAQVNFTGAVSVGVLIADAMRHQRRTGPRHIIFISSLAGEEVRRANFVYGATKAGADAFYLHLGEAVAHDDVKVIVVRPGFVRTHLTQGEPLKAFSTTPQRVAAATLQGIDAGRDIVRVPRVFSVLTPLYSAIPRRLRRLLPF